MHLKTSLLFVQAVQRQLQRHVERLQAPVPLLRFRALRKVSSLDLPTAYTYSYTYTYTYTYPEGFIFGSANCCPKKSNSGKNYHLVRSVLLSEKKI